MGIAVGKRIEAGTEQDVLANAATDRSGELVFRQTAADDQQRSNERRATVPRVAFVEEGFRRPALGVGANNPERERIVEDFRRVEELMGGPAQRHAPRGRAGLLVLHVLRVLAPAREE